MIFAADIDCPLYLEQSEHIKYQENTKGPSRNVSFYIKFSVLEVGHTQKKTQKHSFRHAIVGALCWKVTLLC